MVGTSVFDVLVIVVILLNAALLGLETYEPGGGTQRAIELLDTAFVAFFVAELAIRIGAYGPHPLRFFRGGWNVFDFVVITAAVLPLGQNTALLRLVRLARITRLVRLFPDMRLLVRAVARSVPRVASLMLLTVFLIYVYAVIGWLIFADEYPDQWGNLGEAMLTLFVMTTLENLPDVIAQGRAVSDWTLAYFVSFAVVAAFVLFNLLIGIVISSLEESRAIVAEEELETALGHEPTPSERERLIGDRMVALKRALAELESELAARDRAL